jgi:TolB protein
MADPLEEHELERALDRLATEVRFPRTPDVTAAVQDRLGEMSVARPPRKHLWLRPLTISWRQVIVAAAALAVAAAGIGFAAWAFLGNEGVRPGHIVPVPPVPHGNGLIAYLRTEVGGGRAVYVVRPDGSGVRRVTPSSMNVGTVAWSPDGSELSFSAPALGQVNRVENQALWLINADGANLRRLTGFDANYSPTWSPDGSMIAFESDSAGNPGIYIIEADGTGRRGLIGGQDQPYENTQPAWSPDGTHILFSRIKLRTGTEGPPIDTWHLYSIRPDGTGLRKVVSDGSLDGAWSPDGKKIAYVGSGMSGHGGDLMIANADGTNAHVLLSCPNGCVGYAGVTWSPNGRELAYWAELVPSVAQSQRGFLYVVDAATGRIVRQLSDGATDDCCPSWQALPLASPQPTPSPSSTAQPSLPVILHGDGVEDFAMLSRTVGWLLTDHHLLLTSDGWKSAADVRPPELPAGQVPGVSFPDAGHGWVAVAAGDPNNPGTATIYRTVDGGRRWTRSTLRVAASRLSGYSAEPRFIDLQHGWLAVGLPSNTMFDNGGMLYQTSDGGATWTYLDHVPWSGDVEFTGPSTGWALGGADLNTILYRTADGGRTWHPVRIAARGNGLVGFSLPEFVSSTDGVVEAHDQGGMITFWVTHDGGSTWVRASTLQDAAFADWVAIPVPFRAMDSNNWVAAVNGGRLYMTRDAGRTWTRSDVGADWILGISDAVQFPAVDEGWIVSCGSTAQGTCAPASLVLVLHGGMAWTSVQPIVTKPGR